MLTMKYTLLLPLLIASCLIGGSVKGQTKHVSFTITDSTWLKPGGFVTFNLFGKEVEKQLEYTFFIFDDGTVMNVPTGIWVIHRKPFLFVFTDGTPVRGGDLQVSGYYEIEKNTAP